MTTSCCGEGEERREQRRGCWETSKEEVRGPVGVVEVELDTDVVVFNSGILPLISLVVAVLILTKFSSSCASIRYKNSVCCLQCCLEALPVGLLFAASAVVSRQPV